MPQLFDGVQSLMDSVARRLDRRPAGFSEWLRQVETWLEKGHMVMTARCPPLRFDGLEALTRFENDDIQSDNLGRYLTTPDDFLEVREMRSSVIGEIEPVTLTYQPPATFTHVGHMHSDNPVQPCYTVQAGKFYLADYLLAPIDLNYWQKIPQLAVVADDDTRTAWADHPVVQADDAIYLHGILTAAHHEYRNAQQEMSEFAQYCSYVASLNSQTARSRSGGSPARTVIVGGIA